MKPKPTELPPEKLIFKVNVIAPSDGAPGGSRFFPAGDPSPYDDIAEVPDHLKPFVVTADDEPEAEVEGQANFTLGVVYQMTESGQRGRALSRQVAELEREADQRDYVEEQLSTPLRPDIADALEDQNAQRVGRQMAEAKPQQSGATKLPKPLLPNQEVKKTMTFRLERQPSGKTSTRFFVYDAANSIVGTINVPNESVGDLQKHWKDVSPSSPKNAASARKQNPAVAAMVKASKERGPISRQAILRGC